MKDTLPARVRLGEFGFDLNTGELSGGGETVRLGEKPFRVLLILVERGNELATREEIQKRLWPNDTVVDFEHGINAAIKNLRRALGDSADKPKYIETLARRGYRLMVAVEWAPAPTPWPNNGHKSGAPAELKPSELAGRTVSHYRVQDIIGGGGMGVVYRAEDLKLGRQVALKFLPEELGGEPQALDRFSREARAASSLDHPNICHIYEFGEHEGQPFIVMQLMEGRTLRDRLEAAEARTALPLEELLAVGIQVSEGLQAAHEKGIIHRDIKPANIFLTSKGVVKILDFGLAKLVEAEPPPPHVSVILSDEVAAATEESKDPYSHGDLSAIGVPRLAAQTPGRSLGMTHENNGADDAAPLQPATPADATLTRTGAAMGTAGYMSPEQVRGEKLDARSDIFSFGLVLYEMATGQRAFAGETAAIVHDGIVNKVPIPLHDLNSKLPPKLEEVITRALEKDRERRYQSAAEMRVELEKVGRGRQFRVAATYVPHRRRWFAAAALLLAVVVGGALYWRSRNTIKLTDQDTIVLADFVNTTGDPVFDDALTTALRTELEQTPFLKLLEADKVRATLKLLNRPEEAKLTPDLARDVCVRTNSKALVVGSIADSGNHYRIALKAANCETGKSTTVEAQAENRDQIAKMLGVVGRELRGKLGEPQASLQKFNKPLEQATSASLEALQAYTLGQKARDRSELDAVPHLKRALELDPGLAAAYASLGSAYVNLSERTLATQNFRRAYELRDRASLRDRFYIETHYYRDITGELEKAIQVTTDWAQTYPDHPYAHGNLGFLYRKLGRYEEAIAEERRALRLAPYHWQAVYDLMVACIALGRWDEAKTAFDEAQAHHLNSPLLGEQRYLLAFLQADNAAMEEQVAWARGRNGAEEWLLIAQADTEAYHGRFEKSRELTQRAVDSARGDNELEAAATFRANEAQREAEIGNTAQARVKAAEAMVMSAGPSLDIEQSAAVTFARAGNSAQATELAKKLNRELPLDTLFQGYGWPLIGAASEIGKDNPTKALDMLRAAAPYELTDLYSAYLRGLAYLGLGQGKEAAAEFQKLIDHPGLLGNWITGALSRLYLGRALVMMGDKTAARKSYQDFLILWKDADPDIPIYRQAKAEYAELR